MLRSIDRSMYFSKPKDFIINMIVDLKNKKYASSGDEQNSPLHLIKDL